MTHTIRARLIGLTATLGIPAVLAGLPGHACRDRRQPHPRPGAHP